MDVSSRIVAGLFDFLAHKEIDYNLLYELMDGGDNVVFVPDSLHAHAGFVPWRQFGDLIEAFERVLASDDWASEFVRYSLEHSAPWTQHARIAAPQMINAWQFYQYLSVWFPRFEMPLLLTSVSNGHEQFSLSVKLSPEAGRPQTFKLLGEYFRQIAGVIGRPLPILTANQSNDTCSYVIQFSDGSGKSRRVGVRFREMFSEQSQLTAVHEFYSGLIADYEKVLQERLHGQKIRSPQAHLDALFSNVDAIILLSDHNGDILSANKPFYDLLSSISTGTDKSERAFVKYLSDQISEVYACGKNHDREYMFPTLAGDRWYTIKGSPVMDDSGTVIACTSIGFDITKQKTLEKLALEAKSDLETNSKVRTMFVSNVSHELRTPLTSILGFVELLQGREVSREKMAAYLKTIQTNGHILLDLINNMLDIAKIESGQSVLTMVPVNLTECFAELRESLARDVGEKNLQFTFEVDESIPTIAYSDGRRIRQVVSNLVNNSLKFTTEGFVSVSIGPAKPTPDNRHKFIEVHVRDSGKGIEKIHIPRLFSPDHVGDRKPGADLPGAGISLYLSKKIANELKGDIYYIDKQERGAHFVFTFSTGIETDEQRNLESYREFSDIRTPDQVLANRRILLMDDILDIQMLYSTILRMAGAHVDVADNGRIGLALANKQTYDLIMVDLKMPEMDGFETTRRLRSSGFTLPIIALTSYARPQERLASLQAGCSDHISKPVGASQLVEKISRWLTHPQG